MVRLAVKLDVFDSYYRKESPNILAGIASYIDERVSKEIVILLFPGILLRLNPHLGMSPFLPLTAGCIPAQAGGDG